MRRNKPYYIAVLLSMFWCSSAWSQTIFNGELINTNDSLPIRYALIDLKDGEQHVLTDSLGRFLMKFPNGTKAFTLEISAIGCRATIAYKPIWSGVERIYIDVAANQLAEYVIKGLSARQVLEKAVSLIPKNNETKSHFAYCFYRQYEKANNRIRNLIETDNAIMYKLSVNKNIIVPIESFAIRHLRRSKYEKVIPDFAEGDIGDVLVDDPIYHLAESSLNPGLFRRYSINFDTTHKTDDYVIHYNRWDFSSDSHGIGYYSYDLFYGEATEEGDVTIERGTFAIKKITRKAMINPNYDYGPPESQLNIVQPSKRYFFRFVDGETVAEYAPMNGKWHIAKLFHQYTNNFFYTIFASFAFNLTEYSELYGDSVSRYVGEDIVKQFYSKSYLERRRYKYDSTYWSQADRPFYFLKKEDIFKGLEYDGPLVKQFIEEGEKE